MADNDVWEELVLERRKRRALEKQVSHVIQIFRAFTGIVREMSFIIGKLFGRIFIYDVEIICKDNIHEVDITGFPSQVEELRGRALLAETKLREEEKLSKEASNLRREKVGHLLQKRI